MILNIKERLMLIGILPQEGSLLEMTDIYDLARELKMSDEEKQQVQFIESGSYIKWDDTKDPNKDIHINSDQLKIIRKSLDKLDKEGKIKLELIPLIQKING